MLTTHHHLLLLPLCLRKSAKKVRGQPAAQDTSVRVGLELLLLFLPGKQTCVLNLSLIINYFRSLRYSRAARSKSNSAPPAAPTKRSRSSSGDVEIVRREVRRREDGSRVPGRPIKRPKLCHPDGSTNKVQCRHCLEWRSRANIARHEDRLCPLNPVSNVLP